MKIIRPACDGCGAIAGEIIKAEGVLTFRYTDRRSMRGSTIAEATRWEYGGAVRPPRDGPPPPGGRIFKQRHAFTISDPRPGRSPQPGAANVDHFMWVCARCQRPLAFERARLSRALDDFDRTGQVQTVRVASYPLGRQ